MSKTNKRTIGVDEKFTVAHAIAVGEEKNATVLSNIRAWIIQSLPNTLLVDGGLDVHELILKEMALVVAPQPTPETVDQLVEFGPEHISTVQLVRAFLSNSVCRAISGRIFGEDDVSSESIDDCIGDYWLERMDEIGERTESEEKITSKQRKKCVRHVKLAIVEYDGPCKFDPYEIANQCKCSLVIATQSLEKLKDQGLLKRDDKSMVYRRLTLGETLVRLRQEFKQRFMVEPKVAHSICDSPQKRLLADVRNICNKMRQLIGRTSDNDAITFQELDHEFHRHLYKLAGLRAQRVGNIFGAKGPTGHIVFSAEVCGQTVDEHEAILDAIERGNPVEAAQAATTHLRCSVDRFHARLREFSPDTVRDVIQGWFETLKGESVDHVIPLFQKMGKDDLFLFVSIDGLPLEMEDGQQVLCDEICNSINRGATLVYVRPTVERWEQLYRDGRIDRDASVLVDHRERFERFLGQLQSKSGKSPTEIRERVHWIESDVADSLPWVLPGFTWAMFQSLDDRPQLTLRLPKRSGGTEHIVHLVRTTTDEHDKLFHLGSQVLQHERDNANDLAHREFARHTLEKFFPPSFYADKPFKSDLSET